MKFTLQRHTALTAIAAVQAAVGRGTVNILENVLLQASDGILDLTATNGDLQIRHTIPEVRMERAGAITVSADRLRSAVTSLAEGADFSFEFDPDSEDKRATLRSGKARFSMFTLSASGFPLMSDEVGPVGFVLDAAAMARLLTNGVAVAARGDKSRTYLDAAFLHRASNGKLRAVSTDAKRLTWVESGPVDGIADWAGVVLPSGMVDVATRLIKSQAPDVAVTFDAGETLVRFGIGRSTLVSKVMGGRYVEYMRVVPSGYIATATIDTGILIGAINRALVMMDDSTQCLTLSFESGGLALSTSTANAGDLADRVDAEYEGEPQKLNINGNYLSDLLSRIRTENVVLRIAERQACVTVNETGESDMFSLTAPQAG